jgi:Zn-dependent peptidase ImmA (M78 family)
MIIEIEKKAEEILKEASVRTVPVPIEDVAYSLKIKISKAPSTDFSGLLIRKDGHALIGVNSSEAVVRQRFTIAHELGHFFLHPQKDTFIDFRKGKKKGEVRSPREKHADMFAAALLMPRELLLKDFKKMAKGGASESLIPKLAKQYAVSEDAMRIRLLNLTSLFA